MAAFPTEPSSTVCTVHVMVNGYCRTCGKRSDSTTAPPTPVAPVDPGRRSIPPWARR